MVDGDGRILGLNGAPLITRYPAPGRAEQDADAVWRTTRAVARRALAGAGLSARQIGAVALTTQRASGVLWDRQSGRAASPLVLWSDLRGAGRAGELLAAGYPLSPQQPATRLESMVAESGRAPGELAWGGLDSWLIWRLSGGGMHVADRSQAWPSGYLSLPDLAWNERLIEHQGLGELTFPRLTDTFGAVGELNSRVLGAALPITASVADQQAALVAHGEAPGTAKITWGTSGTFDLMTEGLDFSGLPSLPPLVVWQADGATRHCIEGMILAAGSAVDWLRRTMGIAHIQAFDRAASACEDSAGACFLPALYGLGAPHGQPAARGRLVGLSAQTGRGHIARAGYEGLAWRAREIIERAGLPTGVSIGVDGGLTRSAGFLQILSDALGRPVRPLASREATLLGAALLARRGAGLGGEAAFRAGLATGHAVQPTIDPARSAARFEAWTAAVYG